MIELKFPDGAARQYPEGVTGREVAASISPSLAKKPALVELNGAQLDLDRTLETGGDFRLLRREDPEALADKGVKIQAISTSEIKISVLIDAAYAELAVRALHGAYGLENA